MAQQHEITLHPLSPGYIGTIEYKPTNTKAKTQKGKVETIVILDRSGSMDDYTYEIVHDVLPKVFDLLTYDPTTKVHLIAFDNVSEYHNVTIEGLKALNVRSRNWTCMAPAVQKLTELFVNFEAEQVSAVRILTISDGIIDDPNPTSEAGDKLAEFAKTMNVSVNSQAVRLFTSYCQPDTTALCSLLQLNNTEKSKLTDINAEQHHDTMAMMMTELFASDNFLNSHFLICDKPIFHKLPWDNHGVVQVPLFHNKRNLFWLDSIPERLTINDDEVKVTVEELPSADTLQLLLKTKLDFAIDRIKILKVVDTESSKKAIKKIVDYFTKMEAKMLSLSPATDLDPRAIENRARLLRMNKGKISTLLASIAGDEKVAMLNAAQKADYLRSVNVTAAAGRGLAKRAMKGKKKALDFDEVVRKEVLQMKAHMYELKDIDCKNHNVSFYSQATTLDGIKYVVELVDDVDFASYTANDIMPIFNLVGVACSGPKGDFPDARSWSVKETFAGCYVSVADISVALSLDSTLKVPGRNKEITNVIPVFEDERIGAFLRQHAPSMLEYSSSIGMRRVISNVPMTFGYTVIAGIRRLTYELNKTKSSAHVEAFNQMVTTALSYAGKYFGFIDKMMKQKKVKNTTMYLGNNGIGSVMVPLIKYIKEGGDKEKIAAILRSVYSYEVWRGVSKDFKTKPDFDKIVKEMLHKLLNIDLKANKVILQPIFAAESKEITFHDSYTINKEYLSTIAQPLYYHNYMSFLPFLIASTVNGRSADIKQMPEMTKKTIVDTFGVDYSYGEFVFFNVFQALAHPRSATRVDTKEEKMKLIDVKNKAEMIEEVKRYVRKEFADLYNYELKMKRRKEEELLAAVFVDVITKESNYEELLRIWRSGVIRDAVTFTMTTSSSIAFRPLKRKLIDLKADVPLRGEIIRILLLGVDTNDKIVYNNRHVADLKSFEKLKKPFLVTNTKEEWQKLTERIEGKAVHRYRGEKVNRHGHGRKKASYWALGHKSLLSYFEKLTGSKEKKIYVTNHAECCGAKQMGKF